MQGSDSFLMRSNVVYQHLLLPVNSLQREPKTRTDGKLIGVTAQSGQLQLAKQIGKIQIVLNAMAVRAIVNTL